MSITFILSFLAAQAQENLVPNFDFNTIIKKVKMEGQIKYAEPWTSPTLASADLYVTKTKNYLVSVPANAYGEEKPMEGDNYAGILAFSYKNKEPRSYLQVKLTKPLEAGKTYCVTFNVSLADLSKYACNHLAIALSNEAITANNSDILQFDGAIESSRLKVYEKQFYWTPVCGKYTAKGGESFITIGNFTPTEKLQIKKIKRPRGFTKPQTYDAYYYVDNVSVVALAKTMKCDCDIIPGMENASTVTRDFNSDEDGKSKGGAVKIINTDGSLGEADKATSNTLTNEKVDGMQISFNPKSFSIDESGIKKLDKVVAYMKKNSEQKLSLTGYIDASEAAILKLDGKRVSTVYKYIVSKGVAKERVARHMGGAEHPIDKKNILKNMRVAIKVEE